MVSGTPSQVGTDRRGILGPSTDVFRLYRCPAGPTLAGLVDWFWVASWSLPVGATHHQHLLAHPCANLYVSPVEAEREGLLPGPVRAELAGVVLGRGSRRLTGSGVCVAAKTTVGGLGAFVSGPAGALTDRVVRLGAAVRTDDPRLVADVQRADLVEAKVEVLRSALEAALHGDRVGPARQVAAVARIAETDRGIRRVGQLAAPAGVSVRTLQRMFVEYAGVSPTWVLRRYRLLEAAEAARSGDRVSWADLACDLGYSDQAHLVRDFGAVIGTTPAAYARDQMP